MIIVRCFRFDLPPEAGIEVSPEGVRYLVLQLHYDNPQHLADQFDSSGVRVWLTDEPRPNKSGLLLVGVALNRIVLNPNQPTAHLKCV